MKGTKRGKVLYLIGLLSFLIASISLVVNLFELFSLYKETKGALLSGGMALYEMAIDIIFAVLELTIGISLIKQWKKGEKIEIHKTIAQLISAIVYASFVQILVSTLFAYVLGTHDSIRSVGIIYILIYVVYGLLVGATPTLIKKHKLMELYWVMLISSVIAIGFCLYDFSSMLTDSEVIDLVLTGANTALICLITAFSLSVIIFYIKNPLILDSDVKENEDSEVIKTTDKYEIVKIYETRGTDDKVNVVISILTFIAVVFGVLGVVFYAIENNIAQYVGGNLSEIIDNIKSVIVSSMADMFGAFMLFLVVFIYSLTYISLLTGVFTKKAESKVSVLSAATIGTLIALFSGLLTVFDVIVEFVSNHTLDLSKYSIFQVIIIVLYVIYELTKKVFQNVSKDINDGIRKRGDSYNSHSKAISKVVMFSGIYSIVCLGVLFVMKITEGTFSVAYLSFALSTLLVVICTKLEVKHPFSEYSIVKRKILDSSVVKSEEIEPKQ